MLKMDTRPDLPCSDSDSESEDPCVYLEINNQMTLINETFAQIKDANSMSIELIHEFLQGKVYEQINVCRELVETLEQRQIKNSLLDRLDYQEERARDKIIWLYLIVLKKKIQNGVRLAVIVCLVAILIHYVFF